MGRNFGHLAHPPPKAIVHPLYRMEEKLLPYCDVSGECLLVRQRISQNRHGYKNRARYTGIYKEVLGIETTKQETLQRVLFFEANPEYERDYCITMSCGQPMCVRGSHMRPGVRNIR